MKNVPKKIWKIVAVVVLVFAALWIYNWYNGKNAPSLPDTSTAEEGIATAYVAGGCFWCTESDYAKVEGVTDAVSGYMGGTVDSPTYEQVAAGETGHREMVKVEYDPTVISYRQIVLELFRETDPTDPDGSFFDRGFQYSSAIYYQIEDEKRIAEEVISELEERQVFDLPITTSIEPASTFWIAEKYHQDFSEKSTTRYNYYRSSSGRDVYIESIWGSGAFNDLFYTVAQKNAKRWEGYQKPDDATLRDTLTALQYEITQEEGTETPFQNEYWDNHEDGIYVDVVSGEPLFSSTDKYDSGTGWPSFLKPIDLGFVTEKDDYKLVVRRTEIRSRYADSHLGHIILDGPVSNNRIRYCMNSASMRFVPKEDLAAEGLDDFLPLFD